MQRCLTIPSLRKHALTAVLLVLSACSMHDVREESLISVLEAEIGDWAASNVRGFASEMQHCSIAENHSAGQFTVFKELDEPA